MKTAITLLAAVLLLASTVTRAQQAAAFTARDLVGTWTLEAMQYGNGAEATRVTNPRGLLVFDSAGHVFETVTRANRQPPAQGESTLSDAQFTFLAYGGFWGGYRVDTAQKRITYQPEGAVSPNLMGREIARTFEFANDRLTISSLPGEPHLQGPTRWTWERVPPVENLSPTYRRVVGFWQHVVEKRINLTTGATTSEGARAPSIIVYTPSGYVGVHFPPLKREKFAGDSPTDQEARAALKGYVGYFGALSVYPDMVFHQVLAGLSPNAGTTLKRPLEVSGSEVTIKFPPNTNQQGQRTTTWVTLKRLSGERDMMP